MPIGTAKGFGVTFRQIFNKPITQHRRLAFQSVDLATVNLCCAVSSDGVTRFAFGAVGPRPFLVSDESGVLADPAADPAEQERALRALTEQATPISNVRASREYREEMLFVLGRRALEQAREQLRDARR